MAQTTQLPPPYGGQNDRVPLAALEHPFAEIISNYALDQGVAKLRKGDSIFVDGSALVGGDWQTVMLAEYSQAGTRKLIGVLVQLSSHGAKYCDFSAGTTGVQATLVPDQNAYGDPLASLRVGNRLYVFGGIGGATTMFYDGSMWVLDVGFTFTNPSFRPFGGCVFKNRAYIINRDSTEYAYGGISAILGSTTSRDVATIVQAGGTLLGIRSITLSEGLDSQNLLVFIMSTGEVLAYSGAYPDSADWRIVGRFMIPKPLGYNCFVDAAGDSFVITECGLESLRGLFAGGEKAAKEQSISAPITNRWDQIFSTLYPGGVPGSNSLYIKGLYDQGRDRIVITFPQYVTRAGVAVANTYFRLIYSQKTQSWFEQWGYLPNGQSVTIPAMFKNEIYYGGYTAGMVYKAEGATGYQDTTTIGGATNIDYQIRTAPLPLGKYGVNKISGVEVLMKSDLYTQTNFKLIGDLGRVSTVNQTTSGDGTNISKVMVDSGLEAAYAQLDISGTTTSGKTVGQEIYGLNIWFDQGGLR